MKIFFVFLMIFFSITIFGESKNSKEKVDVKENKTKITKPIWTIAKKELVKTDGKYYFYATGVSKKLEDSELMSSKSYEDALSNLNSLLRSYYYILFNKGIEIDMPQDDYYALPKTKAKTVETWVHPKTKVLYTHIQMDVNEVKVKLTTSFFDKTRWFYKRVIPVVFPDWVINKETKIVKRDGRYYFHVVGSSSDLGDEGMTLSASADSARVKLAFFLKATVKSSISKSSDGSVTKTTSTITKMKYSGARVIKRWIHPNTKTVYTLLEAGVDRINKSNNNIISPEMIKSLEKKSKKSHKDLNKKLNNLGGF